MIPNQAETERLGGKQTKMLFADKPSPDLQKHQNQRPPELLAQIFRSVPK